ncbi:MAG: hypothetical protein M3R17_13125 [Bacteroidota bacterium]|nr:hypothetical protein [Bacteroidota bacterium]
MKSYFAIALFLCTTLTMRAQSDSLGLPGDDLDLCGVLELFKASRSPDDFEKALNKKDTKINNLDLNADGKVDYLRVIDNSKGDAHALVIRAVISKTESQDVAVIELEKKGEKNAQLQIVGDQELYGKDYIIEPKAEKKTTDSDGYWKNLSPQFVIVNVWYWPCVSYMWYPDYVVWVSPWYWGYYPGWYYPWAPMPYYMYYQHVHMYHDYYYWTNDYRMTEAHNVYQPRRVASGTVHQRNAPAHERVAQSEKTEPRKANGQSPVPARRPTAGKGDTPRQQDATPAPRKSDASPAPQRQRDQATPRPQRHPDVQPPRQSPSPRTTPSRSPQPSSRPRPR